MKWPSPLLFASSLILGACAHPEDRRWALRYDLPSELPAEQLPSVQVYSIATPAPPAGLKVTDLSDRGQQALITALAATHADAASLRSMLATPMSRPAGGGLVDRTQMDRTLIVSVAKGIDAEPGDRLMRTIVTIRPHIRPGVTTPFEFTGYTIAKTETETQNIAHLETKSDASLTAVLAPKIGGFGDNSVTGSVSRSHATAADIVQQYEKLNIDIVPERLTITRESERGLDVVGNTIVALTLATPPRTDTPSALLGTGAELFRKGKPLAGSEASLDVRPTQFLRACPIEVDVEMRYQLRHIVRGREYYTEGKQTAAILTGTVGPEPQLLVRPDEVQGPLYEVGWYERDKLRGAIIASTPAGAQDLLLFDNFDDAAALAAWLKARPGGAVGKDGVRLSLGNRPIPRNADLRPVFYRLRCESADN